MLRQYKVRCLSRISIFHYDFKSTYGKKVHAGKQVKFKMVGIPANPFESSKRQITTC